MKGFAIGNRIDEDGQQAQAIAAEDIGKELIPDHNSGVGDGAHEPHTLQIAAAERFAGTGDPGKPETIRDRAHAPRGDGIADDAGRQPGLAQSADPALDIRRYDHTIPAGERIIEIEQHPAHAPRHQLVTVNFHQAFHHPVRMNTVEHDAIMRAIGDNRQIKGEEWRVDGEMWDS